MELYVLNTLLRREEVVDDFISAIWAERAASVGDFQLIMPSTADNRRRFKANSV